jgi:hypothetical protein
MKQYLMVNPGAAEAELWQQKGGDILQQLSETMRALSFGLFPAKPGK